jgi:hypothetical protein
VSKVTLVAEVAWLAADLLVLDDHASVAPELRMIVLTNAKG